MIAGTLVTFFPGLVIGPLLNLIGFGKLGIIAGQYRIESQFHVINSMLTHHLLCCLRFSCSQDSLMYTDHYFTKPLRHSAQCGDGRVWCWYYCWHSEGCWIVDCGCWYSCCFGQAEGHWSSVERGCKCSPCFFGKVEGLGAVRFAGVPRDGFALNGPIKIQPLERKFSTCSFLRSIGLITSRTGQ